MRQIGLNRARRVPSAAVPETPRSRIAHRQLVLLAILALAAAACGGTSPTRGPATPVPSGVVVIEAKEYNFTPDAVTVSAGTVTFAVSNNGTENHEFEVLAGEQSLGKIGSFAREQTRDLTLTLDAGAYTFTCKLNGHDQLGMKGTLTVTGA